MKFLKFFCLWQIVVCSSTPNRAKPDLTEEKFLENHDKFTGFLDNVQIITEDSPKVDQADDRFSGIHPLKDDLFNHCEHPKDLDCKLESLTCSDPGCLNPEVEQVTEVEDKKVLGEPEAPEPTTEPTTTEKASHATESSNLNIADEQMTSKSSKTEETVTEPIVNVTTESSNLNVTDNTTSESTTKPPSNLTKEKTTKPPSNLTKEKVEDILIEEEEEELEMLSNLSKEAEDRANTNRNEAEDRASSNTIIVQDIIEETESEKSVEEGSPLLNFFKALFNN